jgi:hypothetical protein
MNRDSLRQLATGEHHALLGERKPEARLGGARATRARAPTSNPLRAQICGAQA